MKVILTILIITGIFSCVACSPSYVAKAAYQEAKILWRREAITEVLKNPDLPNETSRKLSLVLSAREFGKLHGLKVKNSYTAFSDIGRDDLAWIVMGAKPTKFELKTWWFPIVGSVPYKGFFEKESAEQYAKELESAGYETWVRPTDAFSTLGWFNDPILSTTLKRPANSVVNTVLHEIFHATIWAKNNVIFNESCANYYANLATLKFFETELAQCKNSCNEYDFLVAEFDASKKNWEIEQYLASIIFKLYESLNELYQLSSLSETDKLARRAVIFEQVLKEFHERFPKAKILKKINNAEIMQLKTYLTGFNKLEMLAVNCQNDLDCLLEKLQQVADNSEQLKAWNK